MHSPEFVVAIALGVGVVCQLVAHHLKIPSIVLLLTSGVLLGPEGAGVVVPEQLGEGRFGLVALGVAVILFEGGLGMDLRRLRRENVAIPRLVTLGVLVTGVASALTARTVMEWGWGPAAIFGSLVVVTGPTVIRPLLGIVRARPNVSTILEAEGVFADPVGALLAAVTLQVVLGGSVGGGALEFAARLGFGGAVGVALAALCAWLLNTPRALPRDLSHVLVLGLALAAFELAETVYHESGLVAVTLAGALVIHWAPRAGHVLREFKEQLTNAFIGLLFVLLAADVALDDVVALGWAGVATVAIVAFVVRPLTVFVAVPGSQATLRERLFLSWMAPRGIVAAAVSSLTALAMEREGLEGGPAIRALVFLTIASTVVVQGGLAPFVAGALGVREKGRSRIVFLGAGGLAVMLAERIATPSRQITFVDYDPERIARVEALGFRTVWGNGLDASVRTRARLRHAELVVAMTANEEVNLLFAREARERDGVPYVYVRVGAGAGGITADLLEDEDARVLFGEPADIHAWNRRVRQEEVILVELECDEAAKSPIDAKKKVDAVGDDDDGHGEDGGEDGDEGSGDEEPTPMPEPDPTTRLRRPTITGTTLLLVWRRDDKPWEPVSEQWDPRAGDRVVAALWTKKRAEALESLAEAGWTERRDARLWKTSRARVGP